MISSTLQKVAKTWVLHFICFSPARVLDFRFISLFTDCAKMMDLAIRTPPLVCGPALNPPSYLVFGVESHQILRKWLTGCVILGQANLPLRCDIAIKIGLFPKGIWAQWPEGVNVVNDIITACVLYFMRQIQSFWTDFFWIYVLEPITYSCMLYMICFGIVNHTFMHSANQYFFAKSTGTVGMFYCSQVKYTTALSVVYSDCDSWDE